MSPRLPTRTKSVRITTKRSLDVSSLDGDSTASSKKHSSNKRAKKNGSKNSYLKGILDKKWEDYYRLLCTYHAKHGNTEVPRGFQVGDKKLGKWVENQRSQKRLQPERKQKLEKIGFRLRKADSASGKAVKTSTKSAKVSTLAQVPNSVKDMFGKIGFAKYSKKVISPVFFCSPFDLPQDSEPCKQWFETFEKLKKKHRLRDMPHLVYWYGERTERTRYGFVPRASAVLYERADGHFSAVKDQYESLRKKVSAKSALTTKEERMVPAMKQMYKDIHFSSDSEESGSESEDTDSEAESASSESESELESEAESESEQSESSGDETLIQDDDDNHISDDDITDVEELEKTEKKAQIALSKAKKMKMKASIEKIRAETYLVNSQAKHLKAEAKSLMEEAATPFAKS